jgi:hypothetical protein
MSPIVIGLRAVVGGVTVGALMIIFGECIKLLYFAITYGVCSGVNWFRNVGERLTVVIAAVNCLYLSLCLSAQVM